MGAVLKTISTPIPGLLLAESSPHGDERGTFARLYCERELAEWISPRRIMQINHSLTTTVGTVRGMHYQKPPHAEMKLVRCIKGRVWDVVVDLRKGSNTFLRWHAEELTPHNARMMIIPEGFAHGFQVIEPDSELLYLHTAIYNPAAEGGLRHDDPRLGIAWLHRVTALSQRDTSYSFIEPDFNGIDV